jgi:hypothetical protein
MRGETGPSQEQLRDEFDDGPVLDKETQKYTRETAYERAREILLPKLESLKSREKAKARSKEKDLKGRLRHPHGPNYHELFDASNRLLAIDTGAADNVVREILAAELEKAQAVKASEAKDIETGSMANVILDNTIEELLALLATLKAPN